MTTLAARLSQLSGLPLGSATVAQHLSAIVSRWALPVVAPYTAAAVLVAYSSLPAGQHSTAEHLVVERGSGPAPCDLVATPETRWVMVRPEDRVVVVAVESRALLVVPEERLLPVPVEDRVMLMPAKV